MLSHLDILMPAIEVPDESYWSELLNQLEPWARERTPEAAGNPRHRLETLAASFKKHGADVDLAMLAAVHMRSFIPSAGGVRSHGAELRRLDTDARGSVRGTLGPDTAGSSLLRLPRPDPAAQVCRELGEILGGLAGQAALIAEIGT